jgi:hypothetical protein
MQIPVHALSSVIAAATFFLCPEPAQAVDAEGDAIAQATFDDEAYLIDVQDAGTKAGEGGKVTLTIKAKTGYKVNKAYPTKVVMADPPEGLELPRATLTREDGSLAEDQKTMVFVIPVKAARAGDFQIKGQVKLSVCNEERCVIGRKPFGVKVAAKKG